MQNSNNSGSGIFRQKSTDRLRSTEHLMDYIRVTAVPRWLLLVAAGLLLAGLFTLAAAGQAVVHLDTAVLCEGGQLTCYLREAELPPDGTTLTLRVEGADYPAVLTDGEPVQLAEETDPYLLHLSGLSQGEWVRQLSATAPLPDGVYKAAVYTARGALFHFDAGNAGGSGEDA